MITFCVLCASLTETNAQSNHVSRLRILKIRILRFCGPIIASSIGTVIVEPVSRPPLTEIESSTTTGFTLSSTIATSGRRRPLATK